MNTQEKLIEQFEYVVEKRAGLRMSRRNCFDPQEAVTLDAGIATLNELIVDAKKALASNDAETVIAMIHRLADVA